MNGGGYTKPRVSEDGTIQTERRKSARWAGALAAWAALVGMAGLGHPVGASPASGRVFHAATGGAPVGLCAGGRALPGRSGSPILRILPIQAGAAVAVDEGTSRVFIASSLGDASTVCVLDTRTGVLLRATPVGRVAEALAVDAATSRVFVANVGSRSVSVLDAHSGVLLRTVPLPDDSRVLAVDETTRRVFLAGGHGQLISVLDARDGSMLHSILGRGESDALAVSASTNQVVVADSSNSSVDVLNARSGALLRTIGVGNHPRSIAVDSATAHAFVANSDATLSMLDLRTNRAVRTIHLAGLAAQLAVDARTRHVFVGVLLSSGAAINMYDARNGRVVHTAALGRAPIATPAVDARTGHVLALVASPLDREGQTATGPGAVISLDSMTGAVRRRVDVGTVYGRDTYDLLAVDTPTRRAIALTTDAVLVLDLTRL